MATIEVDGIERTYTAATGSGDTTDVVLVFSGSGTTGSFFLTVLGTPPAGFVYLAPDALDAPGGASWVVPGLPESDTYYPEEAPSDEHDVNLAVALIAYAQETYPGARVWFAGSSKGASLGWVLRARNTDGLCGLFLAHFGALLSSFYGWGFEEMLEAGEVEPKATAFWHGQEWRDTRSQLDGGAASFADSLEMLRLANGAPAFGVFSLHQASIKDPPVHRRQTTLLRHYFSSDCGHKWGAHTAAFMIEFFQWVLEEVG